MFIEGHPAHGDGPVPPDVAVPPPLKLNGLLSLMPSTNGITLTLLSEKPIFKWRKEQDCPPVTGLSAATFLASIATRRGFPNKKIGDPLGAFFSRVKICHSFKDKLKANLTSVTYGSTAQTG